MQVGVTVAAVFSARRVADVDRLMSDAVRSWKTDFWQRDWTATARERQQLTVVCVLGDRDTVIVVFTQLRRWRMSYTVLVAFSAVANRTSNTAQH